MLLLWKNEPHKSHMFQNKNRLHFQIFKWLMEMTRNQQEAYKRRNQTRIDQHNKNHGETQIQKRLPRKQKIIYSNIWKSRGMNIYRSKEPYPATTTPP